MKRKLGWDGKSRGEKLASVLYPSQTELEVRREMAQLAQGEGKRAPAGPRLLSDRERGAMSPLGGAVNIRRGDPKER